MKLDLHPLALGGATLSLGGHLAVFGVLFADNPEPNDVAVHLVDIRIEANQTVAPQTSEAPMLHTDVAAAETPIHEPLATATAQPATATITATHAPLSIAITSPPATRAREITDVILPTVNATPRIKPAPRATDMASLSNSSDIPVTDTPVSSTSGITIGARIAVGRNTQPRYPLAARKRGYEGQAIIRARIGPSGNVLGTEIAQSSGHQILDTAARKAVTGWTFRPALRDGRAIAGQIEVPIEFRLQ